MVIIDKNFIGKDRGDMSNEPNRFPIKNNQRILVYKIKKKSKQTDNKCKQFC